LNDPVFVEMAQAFAESLFRERPDLPPDERIDYAYRTSLGRPATAPEVARLRQYFEAQRTLFSEDDSAASKFFGWKIPNVTQEESSAWAGVASILLNLDEFLTRE
jgi:hypothetical protein